MPGVSDLPNDFKAGDPILGSHLNQVYRQVKRYSLHPNGFASGTFDLTRPVMRGGESTALVTGLIFATIPAANYTLSGGLPSIVLAGTHGYTANSVAILTLNDAKTSWILEVDEASGDPLVIGGVNFSNSRARASIADPVLMLGYRDTISIADVDTEVFIPTNWDMSSLFGFDKASDPSQVPYHLMDDKEFRLNARECEPAPP